MKFEKLEAYFLKENRWLKYYMSATVSLLLLVIIILLMDKKYFVLRNSSLVETRPLLTWACEEAFKSTASGKPVPDLITDSILKELKKTEFKVSVDEVISVLEIKSNTCRLIIKSEAKVRSFLIRFESDKENPFFYKLNEIIETEVNYDELGKLSEAK